MKPFAVFAISVMLAPAVFAQHLALDLNPEASQVKMTLKTTHEIVKGTFHVQSGSVEFNQDGAKMQGAIVVAAGSGKTGNDSRDKKMDNDVLKVKQYATVSFAPKTYAGILAPSGDSSIEVTGIFTLLGTPHEITVPVQMHLVGSDATARAHFVVPYVQWGLKNPSFLFWKADKDVAIDLNLVGTISR